MMYPYMILADETEIVHSQIIEKDGMKKIIVNFERPTEKWGNTDCLNVYGKWLYRLFLVE